MSNCFVVRISPDRENLFLDKKSRLDTWHGVKSYEKILEPIAIQLLEDKKKYPITVIYLKLKYCGFAYRLFERVLGSKQYVDNIYDPSHRLFAQYHAPQTTPMKSEVLQEIKFESSNIRVVFATAALGMGVDAPYITQVIHISPPSSLEAYMQEIGRAGRRGSPSTALLYFSKSDISQNRVDSGIVDLQMKKYCENEIICMRKFILQYFGFKHEVQKEKCCKVCIDIDDVSSKKDYSPVIVRNITNQNLNKLAAEFDDFLADVDIASDPDDDLYNVFSKDPNSLAKSMADILLNVNYISTEEDLLYKFGVWDDYYAKHIYDLICKFSESVQG